MFISLKIFSRAAKLPHSPTAPQVLFRFFFIRPGRLPERA